MMCGESEREVKNARACRDGSICEEDVGTNQK